MQVYEGQALAMRDFIFNSIPSKPDHPELLNPKVREAFEYAIDRNAIVQTAWLGLRDARLDLIPEGNATGGTQWHDDQIQPLPFNIDKANQILDDLGYTKGSDGIRVANGVPMSYDVIFPLTRPAPATARSGSSSTGCSRSASSSTRSAWTPTPHGTRCTRTAITCTTWRCGTGSPQRTPTSSCR